MRIIKYEFLKRSVILKSVHLHTVIMLFTAELTLCVCSCRVWGWFCTCWCVAPCPSMAPLSPSCGSVFWRAVSVSLTS